MSQAEYLRYFYRYPPEPLAKLRTELRDPAQLLEYARRAMGFTYGELAEKTGQSRHAFRAMVRRLKSGGAVSLTTIQRYASAMECDAVLVFLPRDANHSIVSLTEARGESLTWAERALRRPRKQKRLAARVRGKAVANAKRRREPK